MQAVAETIFDAVYLATVITLGIATIFKSRENKQYRLFDIMAVVLGLGDSFHPGPEPYAPNLCLCMDCTDRLSGNAP